MKLAYNPSDKPALTGVSSDNKDIIFDLSGIAIYARGVKFDGKTPTVFKKHTSANTGGYDGLVPAPSYADSATRFLREDGTWVTPDKTTSIHWDNIDGKPNVFNPSQHIHTTDDVKSLTNYTKATSVAALATTDTLNVALGKLEYKSDLGVTAYNWYKSVTDEDTDDHINKWNEIVDFLNGITDTTLNGILTNFVNDLEVTGTGNAVTDVSKSNNKITVTKGNSFLPLSGGTITNSTAPLTIDRLSSSLTNIVFKKDGVTSGVIGFDKNDNFVIRDKFSSNSTYHSVIHSGNIGNQSVAYATNAGNATSLDGHVNGDVTARYLNPLRLTKANTLDDIADGVYRWTDANNPTNYAGDNSALLQISGRTWDRFQLAFAGNSDGKIYYRHSYHQSSSSWGWNSWKTIAFTSDIPTVTNYYWANVKISATSNSSTSPTFSSATATKFFSKWFGGTDTSTGGLFGDASMIIGSGYTGAVVYSYGDAPIWFHTGKALRMVLDGSGNVGIGTSSPNYKLDVNGDINAKCVTIGTQGLGYVTRNTLILNPPLHTGGPFYIKNRDTNYNAYLDTAYGGTTLLTLIHNGNFGIGTSDPEQKLHINGGLVRIDCSSRYVYLGTQNSSHAHYETNADISHWFNKRVEVNGHVNPYTNNSFSSGTSDKRWSNIYSYNGNFASTIFSDNYHQIYNCGSYVNCNANRTGAIVIQLPITSSQYDMVNIEIAVYEYNSLAASKIVVGGHPWSGAWYHYSCSIIGGYNRGVRLGIYGGKWCVILGTSSTVWQYPGVFVTHIGTIYEQYKTAYANKCTLSLVTSESGFSALVTPNNVINATTALLVIGTNAASSPGNALLVSGSGRTDSSPSGDTWIYYDSLGKTSTPWGIKHEQANNLISFYGNGTRRVYIDLSNGNISCGTINGYTPITSGNIGSQSVNYASSAGNADTVDNKHASDFLQRLPWWTSGNGNNIDTVYNGTTFAYTNHKAPTNGVFVAFSGTHNSYLLQLQGLYNGENLYFRNKNGDNSTWNAWRSVIHSGNIGSQSVNYANTAGSANYASSAGNANTLDGIDSTGFLRQVVVPNNSENDFNTFSNMTLTGRVDPKTGASLKNAPWSGGGPAGGYGVLTYLFNGSGYGTQMVWGYHSNRIYIRNRYWGGSSVGAIWDTTWDSLALTSDIPTVTNYYWADQRITSSAVYTASPTLSTLRVQGSGGGRGTIYMISASDVPNDLWFGAGGQSDWSLSSRSSSEGRYFGLYNNSSLGWAFTVDKTNNRFKVSEWIQFNNASGLYWPNTYGAHFYPNETSTYGQFQLLGNKGGYSGIHFGSTKNYMTVMSTDTHHGLFCESTDWEFYYNRSNRGVGIRTSSITKDFNVSGTSYLSSKTWIGTTSGNEMLNVGGWVGTIGDTGWYNSTYAGGIYMTDTTWVRTYNNKKFYVSNSASDAIHSAGGVYVAGCVHAYANYLKSTCNGCTITIGSQNNGWCHYDTSAPAHWFNKSVYVQGNVYGGTSYNRRLAYVDELPTSLPANGGNADTVDGYHIAVQSSAGTNASTIYFVI